MKSGTVLPAPSATLLLVPLLTPDTGIIVVSAAHAQIDLPLIASLVTLANQGEQIALLVADNHFDGHPLARRLHQQEHVKLAYAETPYQLRFLIRRLRETRQCYSLLVVIGLLETFYDEQIPEQQATLVLADILQTLNELASTLRVMVILTPAPKATRAHLLTAVQNAVGAYLELRVLEAPKDLQRRLF